MKLDANKLRAVVEALSVDGGTKRRDGEPVRRAFGITIKSGSLDEKKRCVRVIASTAAIDSYDEIVEQSWRLERYRENPVVLYGHNRVGFLGMGGDPEKTLPIGYASDVAVVNGQLEATLNFVDEAANPMAVKVWEQFKQGGLRAVSVGFYPNTVREEKHDDKDIYVLADNELFEISAVPIPANPEAVALSAERTSERAWFSERAHNQIPAALAAQETDEMSLTPEQIKKLQDDLQAKTIECTALTGTVTTLTESLKTATDGLTALDAALLPLVGDEQKKLSAIDKVGVVAKTIATERDAAILTEVKALVGKKISPAQEADFVALRKSSPDSFASIVKGLPDMPHTETKTPGEENPGTSKATGALGKSKIASNAAKKAEEARNTAA
jgi:hypothetical protein